ncbi:DUF2282 domain-containing protein [Burkholderia sp. Ac-20365]|uniref:BufA1 family periplasmic bufferin-type metallophore n=1 Tax=Burkholderia sp. Ac-20365 TaxID=2703897 RepID=UPI001F122259|nr:DUF2282 domain-containing protein [Burkholderia sp. Ac-20365]
MAPFDRNTHLGPHLGATFTFSRERCFGVVRAVRNDCGTARHGYVDRATRDAAGDEWVLLPAGTCTKIAGDGRRLEYTVIGDAVNLAAKLEKHNKRERTRAIAPHATYSLATSQGYLEIRSTRAARSVGDLAAETDLTVRVP